MAHPYGRTFSPTPDENRPYPTRRASSARPAGRAAPPPGSTRKESVSADKHPRHAVTEKPLPHRPQSAYHHHSRDNSRETDAMTMIAMKYRKHYVRQEGTVTLVLSGHSGSGDLPVYHSGSLVRGLVTLLKTDSVSSVVVNVEGSVRVRDLQGGDGASYFLSETLFSWDGHGTAPHEFNFETSMGTFIPPTSERRLLPPSFSARLSQILPGFSVSVRYEFVVSVMRNAGPLEFWKRRTRLRVPFTFKPLTRPPAPGPFPARAFRGGSLHPQTLFIDSVPPREIGADPIESHVFLPGGQIVPAADRMTFIVSLHARDAILAPLIHGAPILPSFLPISPSPLPASLPCNSANESTQSLGSGTRSRPSIVNRLLEAPATRAPLSVRLERHIVLDARDPRGDKLGSGIGWVRGRRILSTEVLAEGQLQHAKAGNKRVRWRGALDIPSGASCPGFAAGRLSVQDFLVITIDMPGMQTHELPFRQTIPIRLTSHSARAASAVQLTDPEVF